jgi:putative molybdopterin biosynthesis protein
MAEGHAEVARLIRWGAADVGVGIESAALAEGLDFVPLTEERFDLVVPAAFAEKAPVSRLLDALDDPSFRTEVSHLPGYDGSMSGQVTTVDAA